LFNVLAGQMALIGPRPTILEQIERYDAFQRRRLDVRPGITGLAQVNGNTAITWEERIRYDVYYVDHLSFKMDFMIIAKTLLAVVLSESRLARLFDQSPYGERPR
jgi:lipopolysaccharide/colanic/teichoic acid biosynthesis glycosyltransferase